MDGVRPPSVRNSESQVAPPILSVNHDAYTDDYQSIYPLQNTIEAEKSPRMKSKQKPIGVIPSFNPYVRLERLCFEDNKNSFNQQKKNNEASNDSSLIPLSQTKQCCNKLFCSYVLLERLSSHKIQNLPMKSKQIPIGGIPPFNPYVLLERLCLEHNENGFNQQEENEDNEDSNDLSLIPLCRVDDWCNKLFRSYVLLERLSPHKIQNLLNKKN